METKTIQMMENSTKTLFRFSVYIIVFIAGMLWQYHLLHPQTEYEYLAYSPNNIGQNDWRYVYDNMTGQMVMTDGRPYELVYKQTLIRYIKMAFCLSFVFFWAWVWSDYKLFPEDHIIDKLVKRWKEIRFDVEVDEDEK